MSEIVGKDARLEFNGEILDLESIDIELPVQGGEPIRGPELEITITLDSQPNRLTLWNLYWRHFSDGKGFSPS